MSYLLKVVCTASVLLLVLAEVAMSVSIKVPPRINLARRLSGARVKRQSQQCINVLSGIESDPKWTTCITITEKLSNVSTITNTQIQNYCQQHCPTLEVQDFKAIVAACGTSLIPGSEVALYLWYMLQYEIMAVFGFPRDCSAWKPLFCSRVIILLPTTTACKIGKTLIQYLPPRNN